MTRKAALDKLQGFDSGWCVVRWEWRFGQPAWTVETISFAQDQLDELGPEAMRIEVKAEERQA